VDATSPVWVLIAVPVIVVGGVLLHFVFGWSGERRLVAVFAPVNESLWEHLKMAYWPLLPMAALELIVREPMPPGLPMAEAIGFYTAATLMLTLYYISSAVLRDPPLPVRLAVDLSIFVIAVTVGQVLAYQLLLRAGAHLDNGPWGATLLLLPGVILAVATFWPPRLSLFRDQMTGGYGLPGTAA
jgi:hypothetical protein